MEAAQEQIRDAQRESWNKFSPGWKKWDELAMNFLKPYGDAMIEQLNLQQGHNVLDIASGTGEPGFTIAARVNPGMVTLTDLSDGMLDVAKEIAASRGITNVQTKVCDVSELPFDDNSFDQVSCRKGFMFFPDMNLAASEMARVLKPGGRISTAVWAGPENNFWVTAIMGTLKNYLDVPHPPPGAPAMFRCADPDLIKGLFEQNGLKNVTVQEVQGKMYMETAENYWTFMTEMAAPIVGAMSQADEQTREKIHVDVVKLVNEKLGETATFDSAGLVISGVK